MNRIEQTSPSNSHSQPKPARKPSMKASPTIDRRRMYIRRPEAATPLAVPITAPLPGALLL